MSQGRVRLKPIVGCVFSVMVREGEMLKFLVLMALGPLRARAAQIGQIRGGQSNLVIEEMRLCR